MAISQLGTIIAQYSNTVVTVSELAGGSLPMGFAGFLFISGQNRAGRNIPSTSIAFTIAAANARLQVQVETSIETDGDDLRRVLISYASTNDVTLAQQIAAFEKFATDQATEVTLPDTVIFESTDQFTPLSVTTDASLPSNPINGQIIEITNDAKFYEFDADATAGTYPGGGGGFWVESTFTGFTNISSTTANGGCDVPLRSIGSTFLAPPAKTGSGDSLPVKYLFLNGRQEGAGSVLQAGKVLNVLITNNGVNVTEQMAGKVVYRFLGIYRYLDGSLDTTVTQADQLFYPLAPITLPVDLNPGFGALYEIFYRFTPEEISAVIPNGANLAFYFDDAALKGVPSVNFQFTGNTVWNVGELLRIFPGVRGSGQATIEGFDTPFVPQQSYTGLLADTANQFAFMSAVIAGDVVIRQNTIDALDTEAQRAIVSTVPGDGPPSPISNAVVLGAPGALQVTVTNDNDGVSRFNIRDDYPDNIGGVDGIATLPPRLKIWVDDGTNLYEYDQVTTVGFNTTTIVTITSLASSVITPLPTPAADFFLYKPVGAPVLADGGAGTVPAGTYNVYAVYTSDPSPNFLPTVIDHSVANGNIPESTTTLTVLAEQLSDAVNIRTTAGFTVPAVNATVVVSVNSADLLVDGGYIEIEDAGIYRIISQAALDITVENTGALTNAVPTTVIATDRQVTFSGPEGPVGVSAGYSYLFDSNTTIADPGAGNLRLDNATLSAVTQMALSALNNDPTNPDITAIINTWDDSTNPRKGYLFLSDESANENFAYYELTSLTDNTGWFTINLTHVASNGTLTDRIRVNPLIIGDKGQSDGFFYAFDATTAIADPGSGNFRLDNAAPASATQFAISANTNDTGNPDISAVINTWDDSSNPVKAFLYVYTEAGQENFAYYQLTSLTDNTGWFDGNITFVGGNGTLTGDIRVKALIVGDQGDTGQSDGFDYTFDASVVIADPGAGLLRLDNATPSAATELAVSASTASTGNPDITAIINTWDDSSNPVKGYIYIYNEDTPENFAYYQLITLTDNTGWFQIGLTHVASNGTLTGSIRLKQIPVGDKGDTGTDAGIEYTYDSTTTIADPGSGNVRLNNSLFASVTQLAYSDNSALSGNPDVSAFILTWADSTNPVKGQLTIQQQQAPQNFAIYNVSAVTDNTTFVTVDVVHVVSNGSFTNGVATQSLFARTGDQGAGGGGGGGFVAGVVIGTWDPSPTATEGVEIGAWTP